MKVEQSSLACPDVSRSYDDVSPQILAKYDSERISARNNLVRNDHSNVSAFDERYLTIQDIALQIADRLQGELGEFIQLPADRALGLVDSLRRDVGKIAESLNYVLSNSLSMGRIMGEYAIGLHHACEDLQMLAGNLGALHESLRPSSADVARTFMFVGSVRQALIDFVNIGR